MNVFAGQASSYGEFLQMRTAEKRQNEREDKNYTTPCLFLQKSGYTRSSRLANICQKIYENLGRVMQTAGWNAHVFLPIVCYKRDSIDWKRCVGVRDRLKEAKSDCRTTRRDASRRTPRDPYALRSNRY